MSSITSTNGLAGIDSMRVSTACLAVSTSFLACSSFSSASVRLASSSASKAAVSLRLASLMLMLVRRNTSSSYISLNRFGGIDTDLAKLSISKLSSRPILASASLRISAVVSPGDRGLNLSVADIAALTCIAGVSSLDLRSSSLARATRASSAFCSLISLRNPVFTAPSSVRVSSGNVSCSLRVCLLVTLVTCSRWAVAPLSFIKRAARRLRSFLLRLRKNPSALATARLRSSA